MINGVNWAALWNPTHYTVISYSEQEINTMVNEVNLDSAFPPVFTLKVLYSKEHSSIHTLSLTPMYADTAHYW